MTRIIHYFLVDSSGFNECMSIDNFNMNFKSYSDDDDQSNLTFYSLKNMSISSTDINSLTSTINSSLSNDFVMNSHLNKQRIYWDREIE